MLLGLSKIIDCPGESCSFSTSVDLSDLQFGNCCPVTEPVLASGSVLNTTIHGVCDRCAREFYRDLEIPMEAVLVTELSDEDNEDEWVFQLEGDSADLDDIVTTTLVLNMDSKLLCKDDCKGLCSVCGCNRNETDCNCDDTEIDPRLLKLKELFQ